MRIFDDIFTIKDGDITRFTIPAADLEKWMNQNQAEYTGDFIPGCLLDSFVLATKNGFAAVYEHFVNAWTSDYLVEFQRGTAQDVFKKWYKFEAEEETA